MAAVVVKGGHELVGRIEGDFGDTRAVFGQVGRRQATLEGEGEQGALGRVADQLAVADAGIGAERRRLQQTFEIWRFFAVDRGAGLCFHGRSDLAVTAITLAADRKPLATEIKLAGRHLVEGQGAGLVGTDHRRAAQGFDGGQFLDDGVALGHAVHTQGQGHRYHRRQSFGNGGDGEGNGGHRRAHQVVAPPQSEQEDQPDDDAGNTGQPFAQMVELNLQGGGRFGRLGQHVGQPAHFGGHAGGDDQCLEPAAGDDGVHVNHVAAFGQNGLGVYRRGRLGHRMRFAGQRRFGDFGRMGDEDAGVGRHAVAGFEQQNVAGNQVDGGNHGLVPGPAHPGNRRQHVAQGGQRRLGPVLLEEAEGGVDEDDDGDDHGILEVADNAGQHGGTEENDDEKTAELVDELKPGRTRRFFGQLVGAVVGPPCLGRRLVEAAQAALQEVKCCLFGFGVPAGGR